MTHSWQVVSLRAVWRGWIAAIHTMLLVPFLGHRGTTARGCQSVCRGRPILGLLKNLQNLQVLQEKIDTEKVIREALATPGRPGVRVIAKRFGVDPGTVQRISRPFAGASVVDVV
jgi:hypothetical protein